MHDIRAIRDTPELYEKAWAVKGSSGRVAEILELDAKLRAAQTAGQAAQAERNDASRKIGQAKAQKNEAEAQALMAQVEALKGALAEHAEAERSAGEKLRDILSSLPNLPAPPDGRISTYMRRVLTRQVPPQKRLKAQQMSAFLAVADTRAAVRATLAAVQGRP